jgi:hypothetical protein
MADHFHAAEPDSKEMRQIPNYLSLTPFLTPFSQSFVKNAIKTFRSLRIDDIRSNLLGRFSDNYKSKFDSRVLGTETETRYSNIVLNRHTLAHGGEINLTFDELEESYHKAGQVLTAIEEALSLSKGVP